MSVTFINNQPVIFSDQRDSCANGDTKIYNILAQEDDRIYFQARQDTCTDNLICDFDSLGGELLTNGTFTGGAGLPWHLYGTASYASNHVDFTAGAAAIWQGYSAATGEMYKVTFDLTVTAGTLVLSLGNIDFTPVGCTSIGGTQSFSASGSYTAYVRWRVTGNAMLWESNGSFAGTIDNVSIKRVGTCLDYGGAGSNSQGWYFDGTNIYHIAGNTDALVAQSILSTSSYYKISVTVLDMTAGTLLLTAGDDVSNTITGNGVYEYFVATGATSTFSLTPSTDFDGTITLWEARTMNHSHIITVLDSTGAAVTTGYTGSTGTDPIVYTDNYITWGISLNDVLNVGLSETTLPPGCYYLKFHDACDSTDYYQVNMINYAGNNGTWDCSKLVTSTCVGSAYGFEFTNSGFKLQQRLRLTWFNPKYAITGESYFYSSGQFKKLFAQRQKLLTAWFDYVDESTHDVISLQLHCDSFMIDGVEYHIPIIEYVPEWVANGKRNLARARVEMQLKTDVLFNKNC
jgi:hypothetical protein